MFAVDDVDAERARDSREFVRARIGHHQDREGWHPAIHASGVLQDEAAFAPIQLTGDVIDGYVTGRTARVRPRGQHLPARGDGEIAAELFGEQHASEQGMAGSVRIGQRLQADFETAGGAFHFASPGLKLGFSMMPNTLPKGSSTSATRIPSPTSWMSVRGAAPSSKRRACAATMSFTPQYAPLADFESSGVRPSSKPPTLKPT